MRCLKGWLVPKSGKKFNHRFWIWFDIFLFYFCSHDQLDHISEKVIKEADHAGSGFITFEEFFEAIKELDIAGKMAFVSFY